MPENIIDYSIIIPVYYNEEALAATFSELLRDVIAKFPDRRPEIIFVDDGSGDGSLAELLRLHEQHPKLVRVVKLTRNFGQVSALLAGFSLARGTCVVAMSADGQEPAERINEMLKAHFEEKYEVVVCTRETRAESRYRTVTSRLFYSMLRKLAFAEMPVQGFDFFLLGRNALSAILRNREAHPFLQGQILWTGFQPKFIAYHRRTRLHGKSRWTFGRKLTYLIDGVIGYSFFPIRLISLIGFLIALAGFAYAALIVVMKILGGIQIRGWAPLMIVVLVLSGFQMLMLGIIGEYVWRTLAQSRNRAPYLIEKVHEDREN
jgi:glycosyltransferase involved in cell wall biosynthesis